MISKIANLTDFVDELNYEIKVSRKFYRKSVWVVLFH